MQFFYQKSLDTNQMSEWNKFLLSTPVLHYLQSPYWAEVERDINSFHKREPLFFWLNWKVKDYYSFLFRKVLSLPGKYIYRINKGSVLHD